MKTKTVNFNIRISQSTKDRILDLCDMLMISQSNLITNLLEKKYKSEINKFNKIKSLSNNSFKTFKDLDFQKHLNLKDGIMASIRFDNDYGVSVIQDNKYSYGGSEGLYEIGILYKGQICKDTFLSSDGIIGFATKENVTYTMIKLQKLESK